MFYWPCIVIVILSWLLLGSIAVLFVYAAHWAVTALAVLALVMLLRNIRARSR